MIIEGKQNNNYEDKHFFLWWNFERGRKPGKANSFEQCDQLREATVENEQRGKTLMLSLMFNYGYEFSIGTTVDLLMIHADLSKDR